MTDIQFVHAMNLSHSANIAIGQPVTQVKLKSLRNSELTGFPELVKFNFDLLRSLRFGIREADRYTAECAGSE